MKRMLIFAFSTSMCISNMCMSGSVRCRTPYLCLFFGMTQFRVIPKKQNNVKEWKLHVFMYMYGCNISFPTVHGSLTEPFHGSMLCTFGLHCDNIAFVT